MKLTSTSIADNQKISGEFAFCIPDPAHHVCLGSNRNPQLAWSDVPAGTKSFAIICHDPDVPSKGDDVNQEGRSVPTSLPRVDFFHWVLVDLPASITQVAAGEFMILPHEQGRMAGALKQKNPQLLYSEMASMAGKMRSKTTPV